jgi:hypothetical protein
VTIPEISFRHDPERKRLDPPKVLLLQREDLTDNFTGRPGVEDLSEYKNKDTAYHVRSCKPETVGDKNQEEARPE